VISFPLTVDGRLTRVLQAGEGPQNAVFLHGGMTNANRWAASLEPVASEGWRALAVDLPGRGFCVTGADIPVGVHHDAAFVAAFLDEMEIKTAVLIGASFGGHLSAAVACNFPDRVEQLVLIGPVGLTPWDRTSRQRMWQENLAVTREMIRVSLERQRRRPPTTDEIEESFRMRTTEGSLETARRIAQYMTSNAWEEDDLSERLSEVTSTVPTLVIWGADDRLLPLADAHALHRRLPGSYLAVIAGAEHDADLDRPELVHQVVADALHQRLGAMTRDGVTLVGPQ
jgi:2-hydroxy-6-oxonona-2,4-dienedioate hydrolase/4,5:9,10-diseco-3-hydroxy-5,9,17-trioxoandrosta-1(10),2-diene-4-oate hydrolase